MPMLVDIFVVAISVLSIASCSIGIQALGDVSNGTSLEKRNKNFLVVMLVMSIMALLFSGYIIYSTM
jgi:hypothetical protein